MSLLTKINAVRRDLMRGMTKKIGNSQKNRTVDLIVKEDIKRVLICRPNHRLGNQLLMMPLIQEVTKTFPNCKIDLFVKGGLAPILFENYENVDKIIQLPKKHFKHIIQYIQGWLYIKKRHYDIAINVDKGSSSGRLSTEFSNSKYKFFGDENEDFLLKYEDYKHIAKHPVYSFKNQLSQLGIANNESQIPPLDLKLSPSEIAEGQKELKKITHKEGKTICLFTFATGAKCYSESWWLSLYERLKTEYKDYTIIEVLPVENISKIAFKAPTFYSKDVRQIASLIANTEVFIGADSGIMHLSAATKTPTIGLFSVTDTKKYEPYGDHNIALNTNNTSNNGIIEAVNKILSKS